MLIAIIGAGRLGPSFAAECARAGLDVILEDVMPARLRRAGEVFQELGLTVRFASTVEDAVRHADIAIDFVPDELESKLEIFSMIDRMAPPKTVILTPTTTLSITDLASCTYRAEKCVAIRNLDGQQATVIRGQATSGESIDLITSLLRKIDRTVIVEQDTMMPMLTKNL